LVLAHSWEKLHVQLLLGNNICSRGYIILATCANPLAWWWIKKSQLPNVGFLAKQILHISRLKLIKTKCVFNLVHVLIVLKHCRL
jgi:hypothetical protein